MTLSFDRIHETTPKTTDRDQGRLTGWSVDGESKLGRGVEQDITSLDVKGPRGRKTKDSLKPVTCCCSGRPSRTSSYREG